MTHPKLYPWCSDDFSPPAEQYQAPEHEGLWYVLAFDGQELLGLFCFAPQNGTCWEFHTRLLPSAWGARGLAALTGVIRWIWRETTCTRAVTQVPAFNRAALSFGRRAGLVEFGRNPESFFKHGKAHDQILFGLTKPKDQ